MTEETSHSATFRVEFQAVVIERHASQIRLQTYEQGALF